MVKVTIVMWQVHVPRFKEQMEWSADSGLGMERPGFKSWQC